MTWNHRVIKNSTERNDEIVEWYAIHEVHYDEAGKIISMTEDPINVVTAIGGTVEELSETLDWMKRAIAKPAIDYHTMKEID